MPRLFEGLGFTTDKARWLADRIVVDPSRGSGHALGAQRKGDVPHLRTRVEPGGMDYKGYNIAVHEMGHNVEQLFSLYEVDHWLLAGVPNNAFTEALAFVFQARDLELLGLPGPGAEAKRLKALNELWQTWEIAGPALVDMRVWHWMYDHPDATPAALKDATVAIARDVWNRYYAPVLGGKDATLPGIYSHMVGYVLYLPDYVLGHLIANQVEERFEKSGRPLGEEFERVARFGSAHARPLDEERDGRAALGRADVPGGRSGARGRRKEVAEERGRGNFRVRPGSNRPETMTCPPESSPSTPPGPTMRVRESRP